MMQPAVCVQNLTVTFQQKSVLQSVYLDFFPHTLSVLIGRSGSGKTTLLRSLNRLNEEFPACQMSGEIRMDTGNGALRPVISDTKAGWIPIAELRRKAGMLFQTPMLLPVSIHRNLTMPLELVARFPAAEIHQRAEAALKQIGLWEEVADRLNLSAECLSGGQQQRLCLARTLALEPTVLLLDEPTGALDICSTQLIEQKLLQLKEEHTLIMVSHNLEQACRLADQLILVDQGRITQVIQREAGFSVAELAQRFHYS